MAINHTRTWQFRPNQVQEYQSGANALRDTNRLLIKGMLDSFLGRGTWYDKDGNVVVSSGNWTITSSNNGAGSFGNNDDVNRLDTAGEIDVTKLVWATAGSNHTWVVLQQTGIAAKFQICIDLSNSSTQSATVVVSFNSGFGTANGGTDGTATARPTAPAADSQVLINNTDWGGGSGAVGSLWNVSKTNDGKSFRFWIYRSGSCVGWYQFEVPDPVVSGWTDPSIAHAVGHITTTEILNYTRVSGANTYSRTTGGTIFASSFAHEGSQSDNRIHIEQGHANDIDNTFAFRPIIISSLTVNGRGVNGMLTDMFWGPETGQTITGTRNGQISPAVIPPAANAVQWVRVGALWTPWLKGNSFNPRIEL